MAGEKSVDCTGLVFAGTKDGENYGFYLPDSVVDSDGNVGLSDYEALTEAEHIALLDGQAQGKVITFHEGEKPTLENLPEPTDEELAEQVRSKRDSLIEEVEWRIQRHQQQSALGIETNDSAEAYQSILEYVQELRDITEQEGFPKEVTFPELKV